MKEFKKCPKCNQVLPTSEFGRNAGRPDGFTSYCKICYHEYEVEYRNKNREYINAVERDRLHRRGIHKPMSESRESPGWLGIYVAEPIITSYFGNVVRAPPSTEHYDYTCSRGYKIDVKSSTMHTRGTNKRWQFQIGKNNVADYFLLIGFDNRDSLEPMKVWLFPGKELSHLMMKSISMGNDYQYKKYELDKNIAKDMCVFKKQEGYI